MKLMMSGGSESVMENQDTFLKIMLKRFALKVQSKEADL